LDLDENALRGKVVGCRLSIRTVLDRLYRGAQLAGRATVLGALLLTAFRVAFVVRYAGPTTHLTLADVAHAFIMGTRFDLKVAALLSLPLLALGALWPERRWVAAVWTGLCGFAVVFAAMINDGYFGFFHTPIDPMIFGLFEDDTGAVMGSLWAEHRVIAGPAAAAALAALYAWLVVRPIRAFPGRRAQMIVLVLVPVLLAFAARGRLGGFPLNQKDFTVSTEDLLNASVPNGPMALLVATTDRRLVDIGTDRYAGLRERGFRRPSQAAAILGLSPSEAPDAEVAEALFTRSRENPFAAAHPPHVVLVVMESWGADALRYQSAGNDLLGRLKQHLSRGLLFRRFTSSQNGTDGSLEALLVNTPITPLTAGRPGFVHFEQAAVLPFRAAGYRTVFGMGWSAAWRGIARAYKNQGFDEVADVAAVREVVPEAKEGVWGVPDGALFRWALERIRRADASGERLLLVLMTATNHSPFTIPDDYHPGPLDPAVFAGRSMGSPDLVRAQMRTYQYACDALGGFLDGLEEAGLSTKTIVAATGDHNTRDLFEYSGTRDLAWRYRVPFFLAVPPEYLAGSTPDLDRWASHRDIFPTLAGLALSRARVYRSGEDLLAPPTRPPRALACYHTILSDAGVAPTLEGPAACWSGEGELSVQPAGPCSGAVEALVREELAYEALLDWNVRRQAIRDRSESMAAAVAP